MNSTSGGPDPDRTAASGDDDPFGDPRLATLYDADNPPGEDHAYFRTVADRLDAHTIVDLGCGTGSLTVTLAGPDRTVHGIDPSPTMLQIAEHRPGHHRVHWHQGDAAVLTQLLRPASVDLVIMSGNTAQHIIGTAWNDALDVIAGALRPGGVLTFETRNPAARDWESWNRENTYGSRDTPYGRLTEWMEVTSVEDGVVGFTAHNVWESTGEHQALQSELQFRTRDELTDDLAAVGLQPAPFDGGWRGEPVTDTTRLFVITATKSAPGITR